jgi:hypothetical protein
LEHHPQCRRVKPPANNASQTIAGDVGGNDGDHAVAGEFVHEQIQELGFIHYNGGLQINTSPLSVALHEYRKRPAPA